MTLLTIHEVSTLLKVKPRTIRRWINAGKISFIKLPGGEFRMRAENLEGWVKKREVKAA